MAIGLGATMKLVEAYGGTRVYIPLPENVTPEHELARVVGLDEAQTLSRLWPGERPTMPLAKRYLAERTRKAVLVDRGAMSIPEMARKYRTTERNIYRYLASAPPQKTDQPSLF